MLHSDRLSIAVSGSVIMGTGQNRLQTLLEKHLDNLRRKDSLGGAETAQISVRLGNYSASHFEGSALVSLCQSIITR